MKPLPQDKVIALETEMWPLIHMLGMLAEKHGFEVLTSICVPGDVPGEHFLATVFTGHPANTHPDVQAFLLKQKLAAKLNPGNSRGDEKYTDEIKNDEKPFAGIMRQGDDNN